MSQAPTMQQIADLARVSKSTVSRALADDPRINQTTKNRIKELAAKLNYQPNAMATGLAKRRNHTLGLVIPLSPRSLSDPFYLEFIGGVGDYAITKGYSLLLATLNPSGLNTPGHVVMTQTNRVDGMILTEPLIADSRIAYLRQRHIPFVFLGNSGLAEDLYWINGDNIGGAAQAVGHLIARGHRQIACISGPTQLVHGRDRLTGYRLGLTTAGLAYNPALVIESDFTEAGGYRAMLQLLSSCPSLTAVFAANDLMAIGALRALRENQREVPRDVALVGFDGIALGEYTTPSLSTVVQPIYQMGYTATEMLIKVILGEILPAQKVTLPLQLVVRGSS